MSQAKLCHPRLPPLNQDLSGHGDPVPQLLLSSARFFWQKRETQLGKGQMSGWVLGTVGEHSGHCLRRWQMGQLMFITQVTSFLALILPPTHRLPEPVSAL